MEVKLSNEQRTVAENIKGPVLCVACPGSGKTTVIIERIHNMLKAGIHASNILVITFTKEAALQMQKRFVNRYGKTDVFFGTIHSVCFRVLQKAYGYTTSNILLQQEESGFFNNLLYKKIKTDNFADYIKNLMGEISYVKNRGLSPAQYTPQNSKKEDFIKAWDAYEEYKRIHHKIDFDDMLWACYDVFAYYPEELAFWKNKFQYIMIDEYQDTNQIQANIFYALAGDEGNICVVGDDDQSCYRFRGADSQVFLDFPIRYPNALNCSLSTNYRSGIEIINRAGRLIEKNQKRFKKSFLANRGETGQVVLQNCNPGKELNTIVSQIISEHQNGLAYSEMAILYRINAQNSLLIGSLMNNHIPFYCTEPPRDYHKEFIFGDIMAYYRLANDMARSGDVQRILNRPNRYLKAEPFKKCRFDKKELLAICSQFEGRSNKCMQEIYRLFEDLKKIKDLAPKDFVDYLCFGMGYDDFIIDYAKWCQKDIESVRTLLKNLKEESKQFDTMPQWAAYADFYASELDRIRREKRKDGVCLSTLHSAKGLEWSSVAIMDVMEGYYPYKKAETPEDYEEERRLFYVGVTRAKDICTLYSSKVNPSRYLGEMGFFI